MSPQHSIPRPTARRRAPVRRPRALLPLPCLLLVAALLGGLLGAVDARPAHAQSPPAIDGDLADLLQYATDLRAQQAGVGLVVDDTAGELLLADPIVIPCPPVVNQSYVNGFDQVKWVLAQAHGTSTLYLGIRVTGLVGDTDGNGNPDNAGGASCNPSDNIKDLHGIGAGDFYEFQFDAGCAGAFQPIGAIVVSDNRVTGTGIFAAASGSEADGSLAFRGPEGHDLELRLANLPLPSHFRVRTLVGSTETGLPEDFGSLEEVGVAGTSAPMVDVSAAPSGVVDQGSTLHYTISVTNPSSTGALDGVTVRATICSLAGYQGNATPPPLSAPPIGASGDVRWDVGTLAAGQVATLAYDVQILTLTPAQCAEPTPACVESAAVVASCLAPGDAPLATWTTPVSCGDLPTPCAVSGKGCLRDAGGEGSRLRDTFGGTLATTGGDWQHEERRGGTVTFRWSSTDARVIACRPLPAACKRTSSPLRADFVGTGQYTAGEGTAPQAGNMVAYAVDAPQAGCDSSGAELYAIAIRTGSTVGSGELVYERSGVVGCGGLHVQEILPRPGPADLGRGPSGLAGLRLPPRLERARPNPFTSFTSIAYEIPGLERADVRVGVYDVSGRLVRALVTSAQDAGRHVVTWDGRRDDGAPAGRGVFLLRAAIAGRPAAAQRIVLLTGGN